MRERSRGTNDDGDVGQGCTFGLMLVTAGLIVVITVAYLWVHHLR